MSPLLVLQGGQQANSYGIEVTGQSTMATGGALTLSTIFPGPGVGGLALVQTGQTTGSLVVGSPIFAMCGQQFTTNPSPPPADISTPACWNWQVKGSAGPNAQDVLLLSRVTSNTTTNLTLQVPAALNIAAGDSTNGGQLTVGSVPSSALNLSASPVTIIGGFTRNTTSMQFPVAGNLQLFPGFLNPTLPTLPNADARALEGFLQIGMAVKGNGTQGLLACYSATSQTAEACGATNSTIQSPLLGVFLDFAGGSTMGSNAVTTPPGRALVKSLGGATWPAGAEICRDPAHLSEAIAAPSGACPLGQSVGVAIGDSSTNCPCTSHYVDLDFSDQGVGSSAYWSMAPLNSTGSITISANNTESAYGFYIPSVIASGSLVLDLTAPDNTTDTYSFGIFNSSGTIVAYTPAQTFPTTATNVYVVSLFEPSTPPAAGTVTLPPGKYYFGYTGTGGGTLGLATFQAFLTPMVKMQVATGTGGTLVSFTPSSDAWASGGNSSAAFALAP